MRDKNIKNKGIHSLFFLFSFRWASKIFGGNPRGTSPFKRTDWLWMDSFVRTRGRRQIRISSRCSQRFLTSIQLLYWWAFKTPSIHRLSIFSQRWVAYKWVKWLHPLLFGPSMCIHRDVVVVIGFLVADTQLYKRLCLSVRRSVGRLVGPSRSSWKVGKRVFPPLPTRPQLMAVYPALFLSFFLSFISDHQPHFWIVLFCFWLRLWLVKILAWAGPPK